jgi:hypothetical protein
MAEAREENIKRQRPIMGMIGLGGGSSLEARTSVAERCVGCR